MRNAEWGVRNLDPPSAITGGFQGTAISTSVPTKRESRRPSKDWNSAVERGVGLFAEESRHSKFAFRNGVSLFLLLCVLSLPACGYQMVGKETHVPPGLSSVAIPTFKNRTYEPGIEIPFTQAF